MATCDPQQLKTWQEKCSWAQSRRDDGLAKVSPKLEGLPQEWPLDARVVAKSVLTPREIEITENYGVMNLLKALRERKYTVEEVTRAFLRRAALAQAATNCLTELLWDEAISRAKELDSLPEPKGAFFGLPISIKEHQGMMKMGDKEVVSHASYVHWIGKKHGPIMYQQILWEEGCVFYCRTTQPQTIMHLETNSNIYGRTLHPHNRNLTPGGSSGGESALLGFRGSIFGMGGDIGGSVRCPSAHVGIYGFKPTNKRIPAGGQRTHMIGKEAIMSTPGPMTVDRDAMELFMQVILAREPWRLDPSIDARPWVPFKFSKPLKIAVQWWDGVVRPHPPMTRALKEVSEACRKAGMEVVDWDPKSDYLKIPDHSKGWEIISSLYFPDGGQEVLGHLEASGEPLLPLTKFIIQEQPSVKNLTHAELWERCTERDSYRAEYARAWTATASLPGSDGREVDVILCPPSFGAAAPHDQSRYWGYTANWNLLDYPGVVFPVTTVDPQKDPVDSTYEPKNAQDKFVHEMYDPAEYTNAPVSLQIVGRRQHDEKVLAALVEIERAMGRT
ncbi:uncharacterized protein PgNI_00538 [Pyricularia grisea]|uniref:amidase n=1 Tax=Pyricularia grisea TaxID=148305 RepID=A0A6P8BH18_PYRGI|nr:uncharacterized protein PgNI_00538 [Pyricularia grisea]TLD16073.1 hypothetical protein PgNI_00538 [Pyricularia grisea]